MATSIIIDAAACKFSAAHFLAGHPRCGRLHGHNYHVRVALSGDVDARGMVVDFIEAKRVACEELDLLDHALLLPAASPDVAIARQGDQVDVTVDGKHYSIPAGDVVLGADARGARVRQAHLGVVGRRAIRLLSCSTRREDARASSLVAATSEQYRW